MMEFVAKLTLGVILLVCSNCVFSANEQCISGLYHKENPSPETKEYKFCTPWKNLTCCTTEVDHEIDLNESPQKYNDSWHKCGNLSQACVAFWKKQECFYQCSPYVYQWKDSTHKDAIKGVPICADQCDGWFEACKNDKICVENALDSCPKNKTCKTYQEMYGNGRTLCDKLWGSSYKYTKQNKGKDNCMVFWFTPGTDNPNRNIQKEVSSFTTTTQRASLAVMLVVQVFQLLPFLI